MGLDVYITIVLRNIETIVRWSINDIKSGTPKLEKAQFSR